MTARSINGLRRIQILLNTLVGETHVRRSLLRETCELLHAAGLDDVHRAALDLLASLDEHTTDKGHFDAQIVRLRDTLNDLCILPPSSAERAGGA